jgi:hypothetical protein
VARQMVLATGAATRSTPAILAAALLAAPRRPDARVGTRGKTAKFGQMTVIGRESLLPAGQPLPFLGRRVTAGLPGAACRDARSQTGELGIRRAAAAERGGADEDPGGGLG